METPPILNINTSQLDAIVTKAIIESITPEARDALLAGVVNNLMTQPDRRDSWSSDKRSRLQMALDNAVDHVAEREARKMLEADPRLAETIQKMITPIIAGILEEDYNDEISRAMGRALVDTIKRMKN